MSDLQQVCLDEAITIESDNRLEGIEEFYVDTQMSIPEGANYLGSFLVLIKDDGTS